MSDVVSIARYVAAPDGVRLSVTVSGTGPSLVLVHGSLQSGSSWAGVVSELESDFTCFAVDRRGHGASSDAEEHSLQREADDVIAVAAEVGPDAVIVAHSYGAVVVLEAVRRGADVAAVVLYEPPLPISERVANANRDASAALRGRSTVVTREWMAVNRSVESIGEYIRAATPMYLLEGANSPPQFRDPVGYLARRVPGVRVKELVGQDHFAHREAPAVFAQALRELLLS
ncbi:alpha/beta fold hydrolase [Mycobacteroides abscessus]|uniref:alpha/beta fold hydrolase n=1 Tax=Mycobacteroides abscessus TaxID=36809 RepID=UPI0005DF82EE|nr:alpha/beta hydrolase [Mycobacteroides abscessus]AMU58131.1 hydrolase [Mycobacteroides abscessus]AMU72692.1 hydrolase [Mycobacteroides abscessus]MBN7388118.1 alpha/beta fold hydrolase [Mycobacteroides abscessus subsp. abscessus]MBN7417737.1 alpha/beta fold hydrolase [Mycobacteroides abscessus subsp. abscessus]MBN7440156.1 alpha/beta fold hydrolase [Mycobacteroides abscessus subsp. abscessus]